MVTAEQHVWPYRSYVWSNLNQAHLKSLSLSWSLSWWHPWETPFYRLFRYHLLKASVFLKMDIIISEEGFGNCSWKSLLPQQKPNQKGLYAHANRDVPQRSRATSEIQNLMPNWAPRAVLLSTAFFWHSQHYSLYSHPHTFTIFLPPSNKTTPSSIIIIACITQTLYHTSISETNDLQVKYERFQSE